MGSAYGRICIRHGLLPIGHIIAGSVWSIFHILD
jgi:hypothetical protein